MDTTNQSSIMSTTKAAGGYFMNAVRDAGLIDNMVYAGKHKAKEKAGDLVSRKLVALLWNRFPFLNMAFNINTPGGIDRAAIFVNQFGSVIIALLLPVIKTKHPRFTPYLEQTMDCMSIASTEQLTRSLGIETFLEELFDPEVAAALDNAK